MIRRIFSSCAAVAVLLMAETSAFAITLCFAFDPSFNGDDNYYLCDMHQELKWYIVRDSIELDFGDEEMPIVTVEVLQVIKEQPDKVLTYRFLYDENENKMYILNKNDECRYIPPINSYSLVGPRLETGQKAYSLVFGDSFYQLYEEPNASTLSKQ